VPVPAGWRLSWGICRWRWSSRSEAIEAFDSVPADRRRLLGDEHPATLGSWSNLAYAYREAGRLAEG
jgi:hypothetical protein